MLVHTNPFHSCIDFYQSPPKLDLVKLKSVLKSRVKNKELSEKVPRGGHEKSISEYFEKIPRKTFVLKFFLVNTALVTDVF